MVSLQRQRGGTADRTATGYRIDAESSWIVQGAPEEIAAIQAALPENVCEPFCGLLQLKFINAVGQFELPHLGTVEVHSGKWTERDFDQMLWDITDVVASLPFSAGTGAERPYDRSVAASEAVLFHKFVYLRHVLSNTAPEGERLAHSLRQILADPHRRLEAYRREVPLEHANRVDARTVLDLAGGRGQLRAAPQSHSSPLAEALKGHFPSRINECHRRNTYDVPENRFVRGFLDQIRDITEKTKALADGTGTVWFAKRLHADCARITQTLAPIRGHRIWSEIGPIGELPAASTVLQRRHGYREVLRHFVRLRLAPRIPISSMNVRRMLELKNIAELYELWCFFEVEKAVAAILGPPVEAEGITASDLEWKLPWDVRIRWSAGVELFYNLRFSRSRPADRHSYSVPLRPDITLKIATGPAAGLHLMDAKFRLDRLPEAQARDASEDEDLERRGTYKNADIYKMHTYRDAIPGARSVRILYPGDDSCFFNEEATAESGLDGVGAVPCRPRGAGALVEAMKRMLGAGPQEH